MPILTTDITYGGKTPTQAPGGGDLKASLVLDPIFKAPSFAAMGYDLRTDVQTSEEMYKLTASDKVTRAKTACGWNPHGKLGELTDSKISVVELAIEMEECAKDFDGKILQLVKKKGYDRYDLTDTQFEEIVRELAQPIIDRDMHRILALGDTALADADYNQLNGKWPKIFTGVADGTIQKSADLPDAGPLAAGAAKAALDAVHFEAPDELMDFEDEEGQSTVKVVTRSIYNNYYQWLANNNQLESSATILANGLKTISHMGVPLVVDKLVSKYVKQDFANEMPHRIYYTPVNNITAATDTESDFSFVDFWFEKKPQMNNLRVNYKLGLSFAWNGLFSVAY